MPGAVGDQSCVRSLELGGTKLTYVVDGAMAMFPSEFFPDVPAEYWANHPEAVDARGRVAMSAGGLLVERDGRTLLVDAGLGDFDGPVPVGDTTVGIGDSGDLPATLTALGRSPADVEAVAFTHLHIDHTGWAFAANGDTGHRKFFPNARYLVAAEEWAPHGRGETIPGAPPRSEVIVPLTGEHTVIADGEEIFPGVRALVTPGHSPGHTSFVIAAGDERVIVFGDVFHIPAQITHPDWSSRPDIDAVRVLAARRRLVAELEQPGTMGFGFHFGDQAFGRVVRGGDGLPSWEPVPAEVLLPAPRLLTE
ncbi:MBL fold metallo-hydrolase [Saccharopolyspora sp. K220]|uniref:MBL fold metallo-hydrolase n=1 Tax=Saccharopolyspora soli TaxID=2926618 RepID=UPI001F58C953|nr:MBL fold metallo-hydrolase [Saccharopolyspora soli]MCI2416933.1 MBL fold metallo-hydrolase [Saccharopolyspora soli]